jgi:hypothetical protein
MFFLIGGVQPKTVTIDDTPRLCPACGLAQARLKRVDHYLSLFFIPLFPVKRGDPMVICERCGAVSSPDQGLTTRTVKLIQIDQCPKCGSPVRPEDNFCAHCGYDIRG